MSMDFHRNTVCTVNGDTWTKTGPFSGLLQEVAIWKILKEHPHALYVSADIDISQGIASITLRRMTPLTEYTKSPEGRAILASQCWSVAASLVSELKTLHSYSILHRDINLANIVLGCVPGSSTLIAFIIDFDYALLHGKHPLDPTGCNALQSNARFMSPRLLMSEATLPYRPCDDLVSIAILLLLSHDLDKLESKIEDEHREQLICVQWGLMSLSEFWEESWECFISDAVQNAPTALQDFYRYACGLSPDDQIDYNMWEAVFIELRDRKD